MTSDDIDTLLKAFLASQPEQTYENPQPLELLPDVLVGLPDEHPLSADNLPTQSIYSIIDVNGVYVTNRDQLELISVGLKNSDRNSNTTDPSMATAVLSTSGVKVYETCKCIKCPRGEFQDGLGETNCKSCQDILPGSDTKDTGADGPELCECLASNDVFLSSDKTRCISCDSVRNGEESAPQGRCSCSEDTYEVSGLHPNQPDWVTCNACPENSTTFNAKSRMFDYGDSIDNCYCIAGTYASEDGCASCPSLKTSPPDARSVDECTLTDSARLMAIVIPTGIILFIILYLLMMTYYRKKVEKLEAEKLRQMQEKVNEATESVNSLAHPIILVTADWFINTGR